MTDHKQISRSQGARAEPSPFVGRTSEIRQLLESLHDAARGKGRFALLTGEPGIGKSRLVAELTARARRRQVHVHTGRCAEGEGSAPLRPWIEILRSSLAGASAASIRRWTGDGLADLALLLPELAARFSVPPLVAALGASDDRLRLFDRLSATLRKAAARSPAVVVVEDVHWADVASLQMLDVLVRQLETTHLLVIATCRDEVVPLPASIAPLLALPWAQRIWLDGFSEAETAHYLSALRGDVAPALASRVYELTDGNPLFVTELARALPADGVAAIEVAMPPTLRDTIERRVRALPADCQALLEVAAVVGRRFDVRLATRVAGLGVEADAATRIAPAVHARLVGAETRAGEHYTFTHALIRQAIHAALSASECRRLHRAVAEAIEQSPVPEVNEIAYHWSEAVDDAGTARKAVQWLRAAAAADMGRHAYEAAAAQYGRAHGFMQKFAGAFDLALIADTTFSLGDALNRAGEHAEAKPLFREAIEHARTLGAPELLARSALGLGGWLALSYRDEGTVVGELQEADRALAAAETGLHARVLGRLAMELAWCNSPEFLATSARALAMAQRAGDTAALAWAIHAHHSVVPDPGQTPELLALADDVVAQSTAAGDAASVLIGRRWRIYDLLVSGDVRNADAEIATYASQARAQHSPFHQWSALMYQGLRALMDGRFAEVVERAGAARVIGGKLQHLISESAYAAQMHILFREQGGTSLGVAEAVKAYADANPHHLSSRCLAAVMYAEAGALDSARRELGYFAANDFGDVFGSLDWLVCTAYLADACVRVGDRECAEVLYRRLVPASGFMVVANPSVVYGAVDHYLGRLAATAQSWDQAVAHLEAAHGLYKKMNARPLIAHAAWALADALRQRGRVEDHDSVMKLLRRARTTSRALGMEPLRKLVEVSLRAAVVAGDQKRVVPSPAVLDALHERHGLTPAEARLAALLAAGQRVDAVARDLGISVHTARTQLKRIYSKTDTHHQTDLVRLVLALSTLPFV